MRARAFPWLIWCSILPLGAAPLTRPYTVENYDVRIQADLANERLQGEVNIRLHGQADSAISALELDAGGLEIASVLEGQFPQAFDRNHSLLFIALASPLHGDEVRTLTIRYRAGPAAGLKFFPDQIYASVPSDWMPCNNRPGERATLHLTLTAPADMKTAASGQLTATRAAEGQSVTEWRLDSPTEPSWFGFVLGSFTENLSEAEGVKLRVLGAGTQIFEPTSAAMHYLTERTGKHYPGETYTQVFVHGDATRPLAGLALLPESYAQRLAKKPDDLWPLTNELAHQWYGIGIATKDWSELWLSEGISAFEAAAFLKQRFGNERFEREMARFREIHRQLSAEGKDRALSEADGQIPMSKGAWFLYLVNQMMGDGAFENGLRLYTSDQWGHAATSEDLRKAFDAVNTGHRSPGKKGSASGLDSLFDQWVYGIASTKSR